MEVKDVDPVKMQARQASFERDRDGVGNAAELAGRQPDLGADGHVGWSQLLQDAAKVLFRFAIAVLHRGVEVVHASGDCAGDGTLLFGRIAAHHESADCAAAEAQHRELHSRAPKYPQLHRRSSDRGHNTLNYRPGKRHAALRNDPDQVLAPGIHDASAVLIIRARSELR